MDKTISISLGGFSFIVDDRAYLKLKSYLDEIRHSLHGMEGTDDIISDVETRIAELLKEKLGVREVVNESDVEYIVGIMGRPEQYMDEEDVEPKSTYNNSSKNYTSAESVKKKLYRDPNDKIIAGVLSGIAHYLGIDTWITRVIWIVLFFADSVISFTTFTVLGYIILWIILPKAETASQKYEMFGQAGDFETIKKNASQAASEMKGVASDASNVIGKIFHIIGKIILVFIGIMLICTGIGLIVAAIALLVSSAAEIPSQFFGYVVDYTWQDWTAKTLVFLLMAIPGVLFIILGARLISNRVKINKSLVLASVVVWFLAIIGSALLTGMLFRNFTSDIEFADKKSYQIQNDTLILSFEEYKDFGKRKIKWTIDNDMGGFTHFNGKLHRRIYDDIKVEQSPNNQVSVELMYYSKGRNMDDARQNAEKIQYNYKVNSNGEIVFDNYISLPENSKFRDQLVSLVVYVPEGKTVYAKNIDDLTFSTDEDYYNTYDGTNKFFKFTDGKFICENCENDFDNDDEQNIIHINAGNDSAQVKVTRDGVRIEDGNDKVIIEKKKIRISDGTDSLNIDFPGN